jgi:hypothetical protein
VVGPFLFQGVGYEGHEAASSLASTPSGHARTNRMRFLMCLVLAIPGTAVVEERRS